MGYNLKPAYCDLAELEKGGVATISAIFGSSTLEGQSTKSENIVDLELGSLGDRGTSGLANNSKQQRGSLMDQFLSAAGSSKRARTPSSGGQVVSCLVDGCKADLSKCRDYHRRHKVCEMHSKTPKVTIGGNEQRFCQQCSRFHALTEFDEGKRSCRKRLEGHNRRRRKPHPETMPLNHGNFLPASPDFVGGKFLPFSNQPIISASSVVKSMWSGTVRGESSSGLFNSSSVSASYPHPYRGRQFPFLQGTDSQLLTTASSGGQMLHHNMNLSSGNVDSNNSQKMFCTDLNQVISSDRALSLLSSSPAENPEMGLGYMIHTSPMNPARSTITGLHYNSLGPFSGSHHGQNLEGQPGGSAFVSGMRSSNSLCQDVYHQSGNGSVSGTSGSGSSATASGGGHQKLPFSWE